jgi:putative heme-binding domain-containing protein
MRTPIRALLGFVLASSVSGQIQPTPEGHDSPAAAAQAAAAQKQTTAAKGPAARPRTNPFQTPDDIAKGHALFQTHCSYCHGSFGEGGRGADLTTGHYRFGGSDAELFQTIRNGIRGSEMGPPRVEDDDLWRIIGFVKQLGTAAPEKAPGNAVAGQTLYQNAGCAGCHAIGGKGGILGPELDDVGRRRGLAFLTESLVKPEADLPLNYRATRLIMKDGKEVAGIQLNQDDFSIQIRDTEGNPRSFLKHELKEIRRDSPSLMPAYGTIFNDTQLKDLVAYLSSLKGAQASP